MFLTFNKAWNNFAGEKIKPPSIKRVAPGCITLTVLMREPKDNLSIASSGKYVKCG
jgi:hypothetical protein